MPDAKLPTSFLGWMVALIASFIGFISGFIVTAAAANMLRGGRGY